MIKRTLTTLAVFVLLVLSLGINPVNACLSGNGTWVNCTIVTNSTNPISGMFATINANGNWFWFWFFVTIALGITVMLMATSPQDAYWERFDTAIFINMIISFLMSSNNMISNTVPSLMVLLLILAILATWFFG